MRKYTQALNECKALVNRRKTTTYGNMKTARKRNIIPISVAKSLLYPILWACLCVGEPAVTSVVVSKRKKKPGSGGYDDRGRLFSGKAIGWVNIETKLQEILGMPEEMKLVTAYLRSRPHLTRSQVVRYLRRMFK